MPLRTSISLACFACSIPLAWAETTPSSHLIPKKEIPSLALLPDGSQLHEVMLPRYDKNQKLVATLKSSRITLLNKESIAGKQVNIEFYYADQSPRGNIHFDNVHINQATGIITANEPVRFHSDQFHILGSALTYEYSSNQGFISGPVSTWSHSKPSTAMISRPSTILTSAAASAALLSTPLQAQTPEATPPATESQTRQELQKTLQSSQETTEQVKHFLEQIPLNGNQSPPSSPLHQPNSKPLDVAPTPEDTKINCDGGMYFNADEGIVVFLKNVTVSDPRFELSGANELKIRLAKKSGNTQHTPANPTDMGANLSKKFGEIDTITATGAVRFLHKPTDKNQKPVEASGALFTYHAPSGVVTISGGYPWVMQGATFMRAMAPNLTLRIQKNGSFSTEGNWQLGGKLDGKLDKIK